jgi:hypothetical protein
MMSDQSNENQMQAPIEEKREWTTPDVRRMTAGSAEDGFNNIPDGGQPS